MFVVIEFAQALFRAMHGFVFDMTRGDVFGRTRCGAILRNRCLAPLPGQFGAARRLRLTMKS
jgi:hypothetical protein